MNKPKKIATNLIRFSAASLLAFSSLSLSIGCTDFYS